MRCPFLEVPVNSGHQKYFRFEWWGKYYQFFDMPNGYSNALKIFRKTS